MGTDAETTGVRAFDFTSVQQQVSPEPVMITSNGATAEIEETKNTAVRGVYC